MGLRIEPYKYSANAGATLTDSTRYKLRLLDKDGITAIARRIQIRCKAALGYTGNLFYKTFSKNPAAAGYAVDEFFTVGTDYWLILGNGYLSKKHEIQLKDSLVVTGATDAANDQTYTAISAKDYFEIDSFDLTGANDILLDAAYGDRSGDYAGGESVQVYSEAGDTKNNGFWTVASASFDGTNTHLVITETLREAATSTQARVTTGARLWVKVSEAPNSNETGSSAVAKNTVSGEATLSAYLNDGESELIDGPAFREIHMISIDGGAIAMDVSIKVFSDEDISGTAITTV